MSDNLSASQNLFIKTVAKEYSDRQFNALRIFEPLPLQQMVLDSKANELLVLGSNRAGKTLTVSGKVARIAMGLDEKFPKENLRICCVGKSEKHISGTMFPKLFKSGAFMCIWDKRTAVWRPVRPDDEYDRKNKKNWRRAPPIIPQSQLKGGSWDSGIAWLKKDKGLPQIVTLKNGTELHWFAAKASMPQGDTWDLVWFDEEIKSQDWYGEVAVRGMVGAGNEHGTFIWSCTPQAATQELLMLYQRWLRKEPGHPDCVELMITDNPFFSKKQKERFYRSLSPAKREVRYYGKFAISSLVVYPEFDEVNLHGCNDFPIPQEWTRYMVTDPGFQICAVLFAAVPPPGDPWEGTVHCYRELYLERCSARMYGKEVGRVTTNEYFEDFIIDYHGSIQHQIGSGKSIELHYAEELQKNNVRCRQRGSGFVYGSDDTEGREQALRSWLEIGNTGRPKLVIHRGSCPNLCIEMRHQFYKKVGELVTSKRDDNVASHLCDTLEYLADYDPVYRRPPKRKGPVDYVTKQRLKDRKTMQRIMGGSRRGVRLGPGDR